VTLDEFLSYFPNATATSNSEYRASCPTTLHVHGDRSKGLSIAQTSDGRILLHCFAGCTHVDVVSAIGLEPKDLFPRQLRIVDPLPRECLGLVKHDAYAIGIALNDVADDLIAGKRVELDVVYDLIERSAVLAAAIRL
jgi:hypothetical protein